MTATELIADSRNRGVEISAEDGERYSRALQEWSKPWDIPVDIGTQLAVVEIKQRLGCPTFRDFTRPTR